MEFSRRQNTFFLLAASLPFLLYFCFAPLPESIINGIGATITTCQKVIAKTYTKDFMYGAVSVSGSVIEIAPQKLEYPPAIIKAIYVSGWSAGSQKYLSYLDSLLKTTQINTVVVDVKDSTGVVSYATSAPQAKKYKNYFPKIANINEFVRNMHNEGIYVIGRVAVFEDPALAKSRPDLAVYNKLETKEAAHPVLWQDNNKLSWVDPSSTQAQDYNIEIAKDALNHGFDEINFDYVRFPTDGNAGTMAFPLWNAKIPKSEVIKNFFKKLRQSLPNANISVDLFGQTTTNTDDLGIGQIWEDALPYFNYVSPMIYPSHYSAGSFGYKNPAAHPYDVVKYALDVGLARERVLEKVQRIKVLQDPSNKVVSLAKIRPWIQDFNLGAVYNTDMVKQEMKAVFEAMGQDFSGYMIWNASNIYTTGAILKENTSE